MKILPKVYDFEIFYWRLKDGQYKLQSVGTFGRVVARNADNATEWLRKTPKPKRKYTAVYVEKSWLKCLLVLLLPRYSYNDKNIKPKRVK